VRYTYVLKGLDCANCAAKIEAELNKNDALNDVVVNYSMSKVMYNSNSNLHYDILVKIIKAIEPDIEVLNTVVEKKYELNRLNLIRVAIGIVLGLLSICLPLSELLFNIILIITYCILLPRTLIKALKKLAAGVLDENLLISISVIGAFLIGDGFEGFMVIALYEIGKTLEELAVNKSKRSVKELMDIKSEYTNLVVGKHEKKVSPKSIMEGDIIRVKVGEKIPLDGIVIEGETLIDNKALTGESNLKDVTLGEQVLSGGINVGNIILVKVTSTYINSTVYKIMELIENATNRKAKLETFVTKGAKIYTPIVIILSILTWLCSPLIFGISNSEAIYRALSFLVISCPCAIAISVPLSYFSGIGLASKKGILIKGSDYLDNLRKVKTFVFDKTGTLTTGNFEVEKIIIIDNNYFEEELLKICASGEMYSNHLLSDSILKASGKDLYEISEFKEISGKGISFKCKNKYILVGNREFVGISKEKMDGTILYMSIDGKLVSKFILRDAIKDTSLAMISIMNNNFCNIYMFTGDNKKVAFHVAEKLGIKNVKYGMLPKDKYDQLEVILENNKNGEIVAFVGDGINDAPVLNRADIGISMGLKGSASAIEASDVVLMGDDPMKIVEAISISNDTSKIVLQNIIFSIGIKLIFIILNFLGLSTMALAVFADVGVTVLTILNSIRILKK